MSSKKNNLTSYYAQRANEYENIYSKPERQKDIQRLKTILTSFFSEHKILEIACGTGYWTEIISRKATSIYATDYNNEVIEIAKTKNYLNCQVAFDIADAYNLSNIQGFYTAVFCGFWLSHVPKEKLQMFVQGLHSILNGDTLVIMIDNKYVEGSSTPISENDEHGNTYQLRQLKDGTQHRVLKNFLTKQELLNCFQDYSKNLEITRLDYYWLLKYTVDKND